MIIGISGKMYSGKSTVSDILRQSYPELGFLDKPFAGPLKQSLASMFNENIANFYNQDFKNNHILLPNMTTREVMQKYGQAMRNIYKNFWIYLNLKDYKKEKNWLIPDVRFRNEADAIQDLGGVVIRIESKRSLPSTDVSETALDNYENFHIIITNDGTKDELTEKTREAFKLITHQF